MSDFYDSLEDEARDYSSSDSLCSSLKNKLNSIKKISYHDSSSHDAFYLKKTPGLVSNKKHGRPKLGNIVEKKLYSERQDDVKCIGDKTSLEENSIKTLEKRGLQQNKDGSITKSPRSDSESLPFVTREYQNLMFQKKKIYEFCQRAPSMRKNKKIKKIESNVKGKSNNNEKKLIIKEHENIKKEVSDSNPDTNASTVKVDISESNWTDSMKLLKKQNGSCLPNLLKTKFLPISSTQKKSTLLNVSLKKTQKATGTLPPITNAKIAKKSEKVKLPSAQTTLKKGNLSDRRLPLFKNQSDMTLFRPTPYLSYLEMHQREKGFDPLALRFKVKRILSDSNRSNFGDSAVDKLPDISSSVRSRGPLDDEDEELFYKKLMEGHLKVRAAQNNLAYETVLKKNKLYNFLSSHTSENQKQPKLNLNLNRKIEKKVISLKMSPLPAQKNAANSKKASDEKNSPAKKAELAQKAKAYGIMVNARNVFKLKNQVNNRESFRSLETTTDSNDKPNVISGNVLNPRSKDNQKTLNDSVSSSKSSFDNGMSNACKVKFAGNSENFNKLKNVENLKGKNSSLLRLPKNEFKETEFSSEILKEVKNCLPQNCSKEIISK